MRNFLRSFVSVSQRVVARPGNLSLLGYSRGGSLSSSTSSSDPQPASQVWTLEGRRSEDHHMGGWAQAEVDAAKERPEELAQAPEAPSLEDVLSEDW